jgi:hypothetical protein
LLLRLRLKVLQYGIGIGTAQPARISVRGVSKLNAWALRHGDLGGQVGLLERPLSRAWPTHFRVALRQREWNCADSNKQKEIKRTSDKMRFDGGINLLFHGHLPQSCASEP